MYKEFCTVNLISYMNPNIYNLTKITTFIMLKKIHTYILALSNKLKSSSAIKVLAG